MRLFSAYHVDWESVAIGFCFDDNVPLETQLDEDERQFWMFKDDIKISEDIDDEFKIYTAIANDLSDETDIQLCIAKSLEDAKDYFAFAFNEDKPYVREAISEDVGCMNGISQFLFYDEQGWMREEASPKVRQDIVDLFSNDKYKINQYIDQHFIENVKEFFHRDSKLCNEYLHKACRDKDYEFSDDMYLYWWRYYLLDDYEIKEYQFPKEVLKS